MKSIYVVAFGFFAILLASCGQTTRSASADTAALASPQVYKVTGQLAYSPIAFSTVISTKAGVFEVSDKFLKDKSSLQKCLNKQAVVEGTYARSSSRLTKGVIFARSVSCVSAPTGKAFSGSVYYSPIDNSVGLQMTDGSTHFLDDSAVSGSLSALACVGKQASGQGQFYKAASPEGVPNSSWIKVISWTCR